MIMNDDLSGVIKANEWCNRYSLFDSVVRAGGIRRTVLHRRLHQYDGARLSRFGVFAPDRQLSGGLENIYRHLEMGETPKVAAEEGGREVSLPVLSATLTTAIVFFPVTFLLESTEFQRFR